MGRCHPSKGTSMTQDEALKLALVTLERTGNIAGFAHEREQAAITAIRETLAQPAQEPVAYIDVEQRRLQWAKPMSWNTPTTVNLPKIPLYTTPQQRTWVGLTDEEIDGMVEVTDLSGAYYYDDLHAVARATEAKLKEKNT